MDRQTLAQEITQYLTEQGAARVGFADSPRRDGGIAALRHHGAGGAAP